ncbi:MAG: hypothetical protein R3C49_08365 [Planctomycetaceae bacterium]
MTGYTVHTGASKKFVSGWDRIFGDAPAAKKKTQKQSASKSSAKAGAAKSGKKKK